MPNMIPVPLSSAHRLRELSVWLLQSSLRAIWFVVIPGEMAVITLRTLVPSPGATAGALGYVARVGNQYPLVLGFALFLLFGAMIRHWYLFIPGGTYLARLSPSLSWNLPRHDLAAYVDAVELHRWVSRTSMSARLVKGLTDDQRVALAAQLSELGEALANRQGDRVRQTAAEMKKLVAPVSARREWVRNLAFVTSVAAAAACALVLRYSLFESYQVLSASMLPTLTAGDRILVSKGAYRRIGAQAPSRFPRRAELVVFRNTMDDGPDHVVKRVIGLPGDHIRMRGDHPVINGWEVPSCDAGAYVYPMFDGTFSGRLRVEFLDDEVYLTVQTGLNPTLREPYVVQPDEVVVMGDNRGYSRDSRTWNNGKGGGVPMSAIDGRATWFLTGTHRDGRADFGDVLTGLTRRLHLDGVDTKNLEDGIARCIADRPIDTRPPVTPPEPAYPTATSSNGGRP